MPIASVPIATSSVGTLHANGTRPMPMPMTQIAIGISRASPTRFTTLPNQHALHQRQHDADEREQEADGRRREAETPLAEQRKGRLEPENAGVTMK